MPWKVDPVPEQRIALVRRGLGIAICFGPIALMVASIVYGVVGQSGGSRGLGFAVLGLLFGILNAYLSAVRPWLYQLRHGSMEGYRFISGLPFGNLFVIVAGVLGFGVLPTAVVGLVALVLDTGGLPWYLIATWRDESLWDA
ncbi:MAG: hypothetical protein ABI353_03630 [Isosphaeraceae bacterium]